MDRIETYGDRYQGAKVLVERFKLSAVQFIAENFGTKEITDYIKKCCTSEGEDFWRIMHNARSSQPSSKLPRIKTRRISSPSSSGTTPLSLPPFAPMPPSPALTSSTGTSQTCKPPEETIVILGTDGTSHPLVSRPASVAESWIRADIVHNRLQCPTKPCESSSGFMTVQYKDVPGCILTASEQVSLTWKRKESGKTHFTTFYLTDDLFDADILLGDFALAKIGLSNIAIGGRAQDSENIVHPIPRSPYASGYNVPGNQFFQPPSQSYHQSEMVQSTVHSPVPASHHSFSQSHGHNVTNDHIAFPKDILQNFATRQQRSPASEIYRPSGSPATGSGTSTGDGRVTTPTSKHIRVMFIWERTRLGGDLDLTASSDAFWETLKKVCNRAKRRIDRSTHYLRFTADPENDHADGFVLYLNESDMQNDWQEAVSWIATNKKSQSPHLYAVMGQDAPD